ncbi:hypothetical protein ACHAWF_006210, partial [Thalassiosira exigua]
IPTNFHRQRQSTENPTMASPSPTDLLRKACGGNLSSSATLSPDGRTLTLLGSSHDASAPQHLTLPDGKEVSYTLASIYLQLLNPSVLQYRKACEEWNVSDPVKILDKGGISDHFFSDDAGGRGTGAAGDDAAEDGAGGDDAEGDDAMDMSDDEGSDAAARGDEGRGDVEFARSDEKRRRSGRGDRDRDRDRPSSRGGGRRDRSRSRDEPRGRDRDRSSGRGEKRDRHRSHSRARREEDDERKKGGGGKGAGGGGSGGKGPVVPITNEMLVANLSTIVDKRDAKAPASGSGGAAASPTKEEKDAAEGGDGAAAAAPAATPPAAPDTPDSRAVTPATTPVPVDGLAEEGLSAEELERREKEERELILSWLSPEGFQVDSPAVAAAVEADRDAVRRIAALEVPVGDSASVLRAGAGGEVADKAGGGGKEEGKGGGGGAAKKKDFARALEIYQEVVTGEERAKRGSGSGGDRGGKKRPPPPPPSGHQGKSPRAGTSSSSSGGSKKAPDGNPIIIVPNAMTSAITMINAGLFLRKDAVFLPRDQAMRSPSAGKRGGMLTVTRRLHPRLGGGEVSYDVIDNPATRLRGKEWDRVVAVFCQGASWQFKGWRHPDPVELFSRTFGFYVGLEGAAVPEELRGWNVKIGRVSRDRRGSDSICLASFWNGLEEFMAVRKQEFLGP